MSQATRPFLNRVAVVFDFDETLAPDSFDALIASLGCEPDAFRDANVRPLLDDGWDASLARLYAIIREARGREDVRLTREHLARVGGELEPFDGVPAMFDDVRRCARDVVHDVRVEFYLLSCGPREIQRATAFAHEFEQIWGSDFHFDEHGEAAFVKQVITFPEKVRYILQLSKGTGTAGPDSPADVWRRVPEQEQHVPLDQMVYVGDGGSDMPVFDLLNERGGFAIAVHKPDHDAAQWAGMQQMRAERRVENLAPADYGADGELRRSITLAVESICKRIALRRFGVDE